jgi:uncharacterized protein (UPF0254 family)
MPIRIRSDNRDTDAGRDAPDTRGVYWEEKQCRVAIVTSRSMRRSSSVGITLTRNAGFVKAGPSS